MSDETDVIKAAMESQKDIEQEIEPETPPELAMIEGGGLRWKHILEVRARLAS